MAYKTFIKSIGSTKSAGVGFLPVPQALTPAKPSTTFTNIAFDAGTSNIWVQGIGTDTGVLQVGDIVHVKTDDLQYDAQGAVQVISNISQIVVDIPYTDSAGGGILTFISRP